ncbi:Uma2 family endonuclease [Sorangium cellulosum]|uniref:Uma2 family endonuclease n=1 Tax=Sorangium cellulosum TaxID=56 RepID=UPI00030AE97E|nr:Uma2 family endonuclease [Sorangium cellulosum]
MSAPGIRKLSSGYADAATCAADLAARWILRQASDMTSLAFAMPAEIVDPSVVAPPGDLYSSEPPMESYQHLVQMILLLESLELFWKDRADFFAAGNLTIYFQPQAAHDRAVPGGQLRFFTPEGELVPAGKELAKRAESAEQRAESAEQQAMWLAARLRELGVDPDTLK